MRVLYLTHRVPHAPNRGDRIRAYHTLRYLRRAGVPVHVIALAHDAGEAATASSLRDLASSWDVVLVPRVRTLVRAGAALATGRPLTHALLDSPDVAGAIAACRARFAPTVVLAYCSGMARFALSPMLADVPLLLDMVDVDSAKWEALSATASRARRWIYAREARVLAGFEVQASRAARATMVVSERERETLERNHGERVVVVPNGVDVTSFGRPGHPAGSWEVVFTGVFNYEPNETAALWLCEAIWPLVLAREPRATLSLVGASPTARLRHTAARHGVAVTGTVEDVRPFLWRAAAAVAPLLTARGVQNKVLEAVAAGLPAVVTPAVSAGLPDAVRAACREGVTAADIADALVAFLAMTPEQRAAIAARADLASLTWEARLAPLGDLLRH